MPRVLRSVPLVLTILVVFAISLSGGAVITAYAASVSLPGDALYSLKTTLENTRATLETDSATQAALYLQFTSRRLSEIQSLIQQERYADLPQATSAFLSDLQRAINAVQDLSETDPIGASALNDDIADVFRSYNDLLVQELAGVSRGQQPVDQNPTNTSQLSAGNDDDDDNDDDGPLSTSTPVATATIASIDLPTATSTSLPTNIPTSTPVIIFTDTPALPPTSSVVEGADATCTGFIGAVTVENLEVPQGANCTLDGTVVQGNIQVKTGATLTAQRVRVDGNIQAEGAAYVEVLAGSSVGGSIQLKQGGSARVEGVNVNGDIQFESNHGTLIAAFNRVGGNIQVFQNNGGVTLSDNSVNGNLQCKENTPAPSGGNNVVQGNKEDQCAGL